MPTRPDPLAIAARLPLLGAVALVFVATFGAASTLTVEGTRVPAAGSDSMASCQSGTVRVGYDVSGGTVVNWMTLSGISKTCADEPSTLTLTVEQDYFAGATSASTSFQVAADVTSGTVLYVAVDDGAGDPGVAIESFDPGTARVVIAPTVTP